MKNLVDACTKSPQNHPTTMTTSTLTPLTSTPNTDFDFDELIHHKVRQFLQIIEEYYPENLHQLFMEKMEKPLLAEVLKQTNGNKTHAAKILGINRNTIHRKMKQYNITIAK